MRTTIVAMSVTAAGLIAPVLADDLTGKQQFLCSALQVTGCVMDGECVISSASDWNIPQFIEIDLAGKTMSTTRASGENRSTPVQHLDRGNGLIVLQGHEAGRAFSFVITEATGSASVAVARDGVTVSVFAACTPVPNTGGH